MAWTHGHSVAAVLLRAQLWSAVVENVENL